MKIHQTLNVEKYIKKFHQKPKLALDEAIKIILQNPLKGELKKGDLTGVCVYKFKIGSSLMPLAYRYHIHKETLVLLKLGTHENFYRDLKAEGDNSI